MKRMRDMKKIFMTVTLLALADLGFLFAQESLGDFDTLSAKRNPRSFQGATITGQVVDARTFQPLRGAIVRATRVPTDKPDAAPQIGFRTGEDGKFILRGVAPGIVNFYVVKPGYHPGPYSSVRSAADGERIGNVVLTVLPGASISGRVVDQSGQPIAGVRVMTAKPVQLDPKNQRTFSGLATASVTDDDGQYWMGGLAAGEYLVSASPYDQVENPQISPVVNQSLGETVTVKLDVGEDLTGIDVVVPLRPSIARPGQVRPQSGSVVSGRVIDTKGRSIPNSMVLLVPANEPSGGIRATTDSDGNFRITDVPAGTFGIGAIAPGFPQALQYQARPSLSPKPLEVRDDSVITGLVLTLRRGGVISGAITDEFGDAVAAAVTIAGPYKSEIGVAGRTVSVDARGRYRIPGLVPGEYLLSVQPPQVAEVHFEDHAGQDRVIAAAPVFYPGVPQAALASRVAVAEDDESTGINLVLRPVALTSINVTITSSRPVKEIQLHHIALDDVIAIHKTRWLTESTSTLEVAPGRYRLLAAAYGASSDEKMVRLWSLVDVDTDPMLPTTATMTLEPAPRMSGRVVFEGSGDTSRLGAFPSLIALERLPGTKLGLSPDSSTFDTATGKFSLEGILPGRYVIQAGGAERGRNSPWVLKAATIDGRDVLEQPIGIGPGVEISDVVLTVTDRGGELSGTITDPAGKPAASDWVVLFSADRRHWYPGSRRTQVIRPNQKGAYVVRQLPAGSYIVALSPNYLAQDDDLDRTLQTLSTSGVRVTVAEGERKIQDLRSQRR